MWHVPQGRQQGVLGMGDVQHMLCVGKRRNWQGTYSCGAPGSRCVGVSNAVLQLACSVAGLGPSKLYCWGGAIWVLFEARSLGRGDAW
jgi:hypothetical protein